MEWEQSRATARRVVTIAAWCFLLSETERLHEGGCAVPTAAPALDLPLAPASLPPAADLELVELANQLIAATAESRRLNTIVDNMDGVRWGIDPPAGLEIRSGDAALGIFSYQTHEYIERAGFYGAHDVKSLRNSKWMDRPGSSQRDIEDGFIVTVRYFVPSAEARARADEIVAAYNEWKVAQEKKPRGYRTAKRAYNKAERLETALEQKIHAIQATTIEGMIAKARCAELYYFESGMDGCFMESIAKDLLALREASPAVD